MRAMKNILLYCADDNRRMELAYMLHIRGRYAVWDLDIPSTPDVAIVIHDHETSEWAASHIAKRFPEATLLILLPKKREEGVGGYPPQSQWLKSDSPIEILEWVRIAVARKRGPKIQRKPVAGQTIIDDLERTALA